jgi:hypothetical protein
MQGMKLLSLSGTAEIMFKNKVLGRMFRPKRNKVIWSRKKLHYNKIHNLYLTPRVLVVRVPGYRSRGPGSIPGATRFSE